MPDSANTTEADEEVAQFLRKSGVLRAMQQQAMEVNLCRIADSEGFEVLHISHRHHPVAVLSLYMGDAAEQYNPVRLRSEVCRLLRIASLRVSASNVFVRHRRGVVRVACLPEWDSP